MSGDDASNRAVGAGPSLPRFARSVSLSTFSVYDGLNRLTEFHRGNLDANHTIPASVGEVTNRDYGEKWTLSPTGNWNVYEHDDDGDGTYGETGELHHDRDHNLVNEIEDTDQDQDAIETASGTDWADPVHDARGNTTTLPQPSDLTSTYSATYDAWNRLVEIKDGDNVVLTCEYDGLGRRTKKFVNTSEPLDQTYDEYLHFYYNSGWQILETRRSDSENDPPESETPEVQYVWSRRYIDAPVLRDENKDSDDDCTESGTDQRLYYTTDANMNVTALLDTGGDAAERYVYDPYGRVTIYDDDWSDQVSWANSKQNYIRYCGYVFDNETGLCHVRHRSYHPALGRWMQRDPLGLIAFLSSTIATTEHSRVSDFDLKRPLAKQPAVNLWWEEGNIPLRPNESFRIELLSATETDNFAYSEKGALSLYGYCDSHPIVFQDSLGLLRRRFRTISSAKPYFCCDLDFWGAAAGICRCKITTSESWGALSLELCMAAWLEPCCFLSVKYNTAQVTMMTRCFDTKVRECVLATTCKCICN